MVRRPAEYFECKQTLHSISYLSNLLKASITYLERSGHRATTMSWSCGVTRVQTPLTLSSSPHLSQHCLQVHEVTVAFLDADHFPALHATRTSTRIAIEQSRSLLPAVCVWARPKGAKSRLFMVYNFGASACGIRQVCGMRLVIRPVSNGTDLNVSGMDMSVALILDDIATSSDSGRAGNTTIPFCPSRHQRRYDNDV